MVYFKILKKPKTGFIINCKVLGCNLLRMNANKIIFLILTSCSIFFPKQLMTVFPSQQSLWRLLPCFNIIWSNLKSSSKLFKAPHLVVLEDFGLVILVVKGTSIFHGTLRQLSHISRIGKFSIPIKWNTDNNIEN